MFRNTNIPSNRSWKLLKEERKIAHKLLVQQSKMIGITPIENMTLNQYFGIVKEALISLCDEDGNYIDLFDNGSPLFNIYTSPQ